MIHRSGMAGALDAQWSGPQVPVRALISSLLNLDHKNPAVEVQEEAPYDPRVLAVGQKLPLLQPLPAVAKRISEFASMTATLYWLGPLKVHDQLV
jgi:hypothetical protein